MMRRWQWIWITLALVAPAAAPGRAAVLDELLAAARDGNPDVLRARAAWQAAQARVPQAAALDDPSLSAETMGGDLVDGEQTFRVSQAFPWPGTLAARESVASREARALEQELRAVELAVAARLRAVAAEYAYLAKEAQLVARNLDLYRKQTDILEQAARAGGDVSALPRVEIESGMLEDDLARIAEERRREAAELEALVGSPLDRSRLEALALAAPDAAVPDADELAAALRRHNPALRAHAGRIAAATSGVELARLEARPEWMADAGYRRVAVMEDGDSDFMNEGVLMLTMTVPLWSGKNQARRDEAAALLEAARHERDATRRELEARLAAQLSRHRDAARRATLFRGRLMPKAQQAQEAVEAAYRAGSASLLDLFTERRRVLETETGYWRALADLEISAARIDALVGGQAAEETP